MRQKTSIVKWCADHWVTELIVFESPSDKEYQFILNELVWVNVGRRHMNRPELTIRFPNNGEIRE